MAKEVQSVPQSYERAILKMSEMKFLLDLVRRKILEQCFEVGTCKTGLPIVTKSGHGRFQLCHSNMFSGK